ncbi:hypothetical protein STEG23_028674 [Scotinomys teguina]
MKRRCRSYRIWRVLLLGVCSGWLFQLSLEVPPPLMFPMTVTPLGQDQGCSLKNREPDGPAPWVLDPGGWSKTAAVRLYFIFPGLCTLSLLWDYSHVLLACLAFYESAGADTQALT